MQNDHRPDAFAWSPEKSGDESPPAPESRVATEVPGAWDWEGDSSPVFPEPDPLAWASGNESSSDSLAPMDPELAAILQRVEIPTTGSAEDGVTLGDERSWTGHEVLLEQLEGEKHDEAWEGVAAEKMFEGTEGLEAGVGTAFFSQLPDEIRESEVSPQESARSLTEDEYQPWIQQAPAWQPLPEDGGESATETGDKETGSLEESLLVDDWVPSTGVESFASMAVDSALPESSLSPATAAIPAAFAASQPTPAAPAGGGTNWLPAMVLLAVGAVGGWWYGGGLQERIDGLDKRIDKVAQQIDQIQQTQRRVEQNLAEYASLKDRIEGLPTHSALQESRQELVSKYQTLTTKLESVETRWRDLSFANERMANRLAELERPRQAGGVSPPPTPPAPVASVTTAAPLAVTPIAETLVSAGAGNLHKATAKKTNETTSLPSTAEWGINLTSHASVAQAEAGRQPLLEEGLAVEIVPIRLKGSTWYRLRIQGFSNQQDARAVLAKYSERAEFKNAWVSRMR